MLAATINIDVAEYLAARTHLADERGHRQIVRNAVDGTNTMNS